MKLKEPKEVINKRKYWLKKWAENNTVPVEAMREGNSTVMEEAGGEKDVALENN